MYAQVTLEYIHVYCTCIAYDELYSPGDKEGDRRKKLFGFNIQLNVKLKYSDSGNKKYQVERENLSLIWC